MDCSLLLWYSLTSVIIVCSSSTSLPKQEMPLFVPPLEDVARVLKDGLSNNFQDVEVSIVDCPDLTKKPFYLVGKGLCGSPTIIDLGSQYYLTPVPNRAKVYDLRDVTKETGVNPAFVLGAAAGPFSYVKQASEYISNAIVDGDKFHSGSLSCTVVKGKLVTQAIPDNIPGVSFMGNLFVSNGSPGKVLKIKCRRRIGEDSFITSTEETLRRAFPGKSVGIGGAFLTTNSMIKLHSQSNFSKIPLVTEPQNNNWLKFLDIKPPLVSVGLMVTADPGLDIKLYHFHSFGEHGTGHFYYDMDPETVEYLAYFNLAQKIVRLDRPS